jgi:DNA-binding response OmpR family regulator
MSQSSYRLLIVDDLADNRDLLRRQLERSGFLVEEAENGQAALDLLAQTRCHLVLLDINMPGLDGVEVLRRIRQTHRASALPVIMLTASNQIADVVRARKDGANDYIMKPIHVPTALARVKAVLNTLGKVEAA